MFSSSEEEERLEKPKRPDTSVKRKVAGSLAGTSLLGVSTLPLVRNISQANVYKVRTKMIEEVNERLKHLMDLAKNGDKKAAELLSKYVSDRSGILKVIDAIDKSARINKAKKKAFLIPAGVTVASLGAAYGAGKLMDKALEEDREYRKKLKEWKKSNKKEKEGKL